MKYKDDLIMEFEETFNLIVNSEAFLKYSEMKLELNIKEYSMLIKEDINDLIALINSYNHNSIVDIGCGTGDLIAYISKKIKGKCTGVDISKKIIEHLNKSKSSNLQYVVGDIEIGVEELYDIVICVDVLYFVENFESAINNLINITNSNGKCIIYYSDHQLLKNGEPIIERYLKSMNIEYNVTDITEHEKKSWESSINAIEHLYLDFKNEGLEEFALMMKNEAIDCLAKNIEFSTKRFRYIIKKSG